MKHILVPHTRENIKAANAGIGPYTEIRILPKDITTFPTSMQIYNTSVSYFTLRADSISSIIIEDSAIATMHTSLFQHYWNISIPLAEYVQTQSTEQ